MSLLEQVKDGVLQHRQVLSNVAWQGVAQVGARVLNLAIFVVIGNVLGADGLGQFVFAVTFAQIAGVFVDFGMQPILVREAVKGNAWGLFQALAGLKVLLGGVVGGLGLVVAIFVLGYRGRDAVSVAIAMSAIFALSYLGLLFALFRAEEEMVYEALFTFAHRLLYFAAALAALRAWETASAALAAYAGSGLLVALALRMLAARKYAQPDSSAVPIDRALLSQVAPIFVIDFWTMIYFRVDALLLQRLRGYTEVGVYGAAYRLFEALIIVPSVLAVALFPRLVKDLHSPKRSRYLRVYFLSFVLVGVAGAAGLSGLSGPLLRLLYRGVDDFAASARIFQWLLVAFMVVCVNYPLTQMAVASGRQKRYALGAVVAGLVNVALNLVAIPRWGAAGAAVVTIATEVALFLFLHRELREVWLGGRGAAVRQESQEMGR
jgi:O-antigen/teichoic acid export membrane protein